MYMTREENLTFRKIEKAQQAYLEELFPKEEREESIRNGVPIKGRMYDGAEVCNRVADVIMQSGLKRVSADFMISVLALIDNHNEWEFFKFLARVTEPTNRAYAWGLMEAYTNDWTNDVDEVKSMFRRAGKKYLLQTFEGGDEEFYNSLPDVVTVYRGTSCEESENKRYGVSWTTDYRVAEFFAYRFKQPHRCILSAEVKKDDVMAATTGRSESEVIIMEPQNVKVIDSREALNDSEWEEVLKFKKNA